MTAKDAFRILKEVSFEGFNEKVKEAYSFVLDYISSNTNVLVFDPKEGTDLEKLKIFGLGFIIEEGPVVDFQGREGVRLLGRTGDGRKVYVYPEVCLEGKEATADIELRKYALEKAKIEARSKEEIFSLAYKYYSFLVMPSQNLFVFAESAFKQNEENRNAK